MSELPFGQPGLHSAWASARKQVVGTALSERSRVWFTVAYGVLTEVYHPKIDCPNQRDLALYFLFLECFVGCFYVIYRLRKYVLIPQLPLDNPLYSNRN
ncbi:hypothetical protein [Methylotenera mobilis]|uniref:hypothetical protein n=1 Tax=Methylotenera mobilis TaxID=359408 RepID=UPI0018DED184|nr:hypothetical protein [Methylotenera mobilis]MDP3008198.1 hypothetical protein [Methylococcales bacterium]